MPNPLFTSKYAPTRVQQVAAQGKNFVGPVKYGMHGTDPSNIWNSGLTEIEMEKAIMFYNNDERGRWWLQDFLTTLGGQHVKPMESIKYGWFEQDRTTYGFTVDTVVTSSFPAASVQILTAETTIKRQVTEEYFSPFGPTSFRVTAVSIDGGSGKELITLVRVDAANIASGDLIAGLGLGYAGNSQKEESGRMDGVRSNPTDAYNKMSIVRAGMKMSGLANANRSSVQWKVGEADAMMMQFQWETYQKFRIAREQKLFVSQESPDVATEYFSGRGILTDVIANSQLVQRYTGSVTDVDYEEFFLTGDTLHTTNSYLVLAGSTFYYDSQRNGKEWFDEGAQMFDAFDTEKFTDYGLKVRSMNFGDKQMIFQRYRTFEDADLMGKLPTGQAATATKFDFKNFALFLNLGSNAGNDIQGDPVPVPYLSYVYHKLEGIANRSFVHAHFGGMTGNLANPRPGVENFNIDYTTDPTGAMNIGYNSNIVSADDADDFQILGTIGARMPLVRVAHGYLAAEG